VAPAAPSSEASRRLRDNLAAVLENGTPGQRKAIIESHIAEIKIEDARLIPIFKIPLEDQQFRTTHQVVGRAGLEPATEGL
jgi:site-specific DNA recombinase